MIRIRIIDSAAREDIRLKNEPFPLAGRMIPSLADGVWSFRIEETPPEERREMTFPDEDYSYEEMAADHIFVGAYEGEHCVGLALWRREWHRYLYLADLKVNRAWRGRGIGAALIEQGKTLARSAGKGGLYTVGQDTNLLACRFYLKCGFVIGGFNDHVYNGTGQEGTGDIYFYLEL